MLAAEEWWHSFWVLITAALPVLELRGAIPLARSLGFEPQASYILAVCGNTLPIPPLLFLLRPVRTFLELRIKLCRKFFHWLEVRTYRRSKKRIERYGMLGLVLLTALPLPVTGAWTACFAAVLFKIPFWGAMLSITTGVLIAGLLVTLLTYGVI